MYVMTTEIWPLGSYEGRYPILQVIGYNTRMRTPEGLVIYENIVADEATHGLNTKEDIAKAAWEVALDKLKGIRISVHHQRGRGMSALMEAILHQYSLNILSE